MGTYKQVFYHIIFSTKYREPTITDAHCHELYNYIFGIIRKKGGHLYRINGAEDHLHIFSDLHPSITLSDYIKDIKIASSFWMKEQGSFPAFNNWQEGYAAFTHSIKEKDAIVEYIKAQKEHHKKENFFNEYKRLLMEAGITFDEKHLL
jgi:REP element-mobilizing transposase RayT